MNAKARHVLRRLVHAGMRVSPLRRGVRRLTHAGLVPDKVWHRLPVVDDTFTVALPGGGAFRYRAWPGDAIGRAFYWRGVASWEASTIRVFLELAARSRLFLDIGANTGAYSLLACARNPAIRAIAYEPVPRVYERLVENIELNALGQRCVARQVAISDHQGTTRLHVPHSLIPSSASLARDGFRGIAGELIDVDVTTADRDTEGEEPVDLVKIDVEGFEHHVLAGMPRILGKHRPVIICECNPDGPHREMEALLGPHEYAYFHLRGHGPVRQAHIEPDVQELHRNYACVPAEDAATLALFDSLAGRAAR